MHNLNTLAPMSELIGYTLNLKIYRCLKFVMNKKKYSDNI